MGKIADIFQEYGNMIIIGVGILIGAYFITSFFTKSEQTEKNVTGVESTIASKTAKGDFKWDTGSSGSGE